MGRPIKKGSTDQSTTIRIIDSTTGLPETAVTFETAGIAMWWRREKETITAITEVTLATVDAAHSDGGIIHISDGYYRLDLPDAAVAAGSNEDEVVIGGTVTGMIVIGNSHALVNYDPYDTVRLGLTALPNAVVATEGGLGTVAAGAAKLQQTVDLTASQSIACSDKTGFSLSATGADLILKTSTFAVAIAAAINELATYGLTALNALLVTTGIKTATTAAPTDMALNSTVGKEATLVTIAGYLDTEIAAILADTNELQTDWANGGRLDLLLDGASAPSAATVADAVWDEVLHTAHEVSGSASVLLQASGGAADPLLNTVPGTYGAGTAGEALGKIAGKRIRL